MIKVVSFDIGGTLIKGIDNKSSWIEFSKLTGKDYQDIKKVYQDVFQKREGDFDELVNMFCNRLNIKVNDDIKKFFLNSFNQNGSFDKNSLDIIRKLKDLGYIVILFSNSSSLYPDQLDDEIYSLVDEIFYSHKMGYTKDENESYKSIECKLKCKPEEILHIGDSLENDYLNPIKNGWNALFYGKKDNVKCIEDLNDIFRFLN